MRGCGGLEWAQKKRGNVVFIDFVSALLFKMGWHFVLKNQDSFSIYYSKAVLLYVIEIHLIN